MPIDGMQRKFVAYQSDDGTTYEIATNQANIDINGGTPVPAGTLPKYPYGKGVRHLYGVSTGGARSRVPILNLGVSLWGPGAGSFTKFGTAYTVQGKIGEKRTFKGAEGNPT